MKKKLLLLPLLSLLLTGCGEVNLNKDENQNPNQDQETNKPDVKPNPDEGETKPDPEDKPNPDEGETKPDPETKPNPDEGETKPNPEDKPNPDEGETKPEPENPSDDLASKYNCISVGEAIKKAKAAGKKGTSETFNVYGKITNNPDSSYGNMNISDGIDTILVWGPLNWNNLESKPGKGDEIVFKGKLCTFKGTPEILNPSILEIKYSEGTGEETYPDDNNPEPEPEIPTDPNKEKLPCGYEKLDGPTNLANPIDVSDKYYKFDCTTEVPENFKYIYGNNATNGDFYTEYNNNKALKFADAGRGIQTPALKSATKYEVSFDVSEIHGSKEFRTDKSKETFLIYGYDQNTNLIYQSTHTPSKGINKESKQPFDIKFYVENPKVSYIEIRLNDRLFSNDKKQQYINFGLSSITLKSYNF